MKRGRVGRATVEHMGIKRFALVIVLVASLAVAATALAGGIADEPCLNVAGENTNTCPPAKVGAPYSLRFVEREGSGCGPGRQTFHLDSGELPPALTLAPDGTLSGVPARAGTYRFYVEMREPQDDPAHCAGKRTQREFTLQVCDRLGIVATPALPKAEIRAPFRMSLSWCDGVGALTWSTAGAVPAGLALRADGSLAGVPRVAGRYRFTVTATDFRQRVARYPATISVAPRLQVETARVPPARVGRPYRTKVAVTGGVAPRFWRITRGRLPRGLRLDIGTGVLSGVAKSAGRHRVTVQVKDGLELKATRTITVVVLA
jgi:Putative Ig domain